jgi:hypothetical protein
MVKVYCESKTHAELVAIVDNEETYYSLFPELDKMAKSSRMIVTESVEEKSIQDLYDIIKIRNNELD